MAAAFKVQKVEPVTVVLVTYEDPSLAGRLVTNPAFVTTDPKSNEPIVFLLDTPGKEGRMTSRIANPILRDAILGYRTPDEAPTARRRKPSGSKSGIGESL